MLYLQCFGDDDLQKNAECKIACIHEGYDDGHLDKDHCVCIDEWPIEITNKKTRLPTKF